MDAAELYRQHLAHIGQIAQSVCRRNGVNDHDAEDFASDVRLKLCDDDYGVIRKFQGKSSFTTYLTVVINKAFLDHRRRVWGKWTPSSQAKRIGDLAVALETIVYRDGGTFDSACDTLERSFPSVDRRKLREILAQLPRRSPRRFETDDGLKAVASTTDDADADLLATERDGQLRAAETALRAALEKLPDEDQAVIRMLYYEGVSIAEIARVLHIEQRRLYPRIRQLLASLKKTLSAQNISPDFLEELNSS